MLRQAVVAGAFIGVELVREIFEELFGVANLAARAVLVEHHQLSDIAASSVEPRIALRLHRPTLFLQNAERCFVGMESFHLCETLPHLVVNWRQPIVRGPENPVVHRLS